MGGLNDKGGSHTDGGWGAEHAGRKYGYIH